MENEKSLEEFKLEVQEIIEECEKIDVKDFTYSLVTAVWCEFCLDDKKELGEILVQDYAEEVKQSLEIMNPALKKDVEILELLLKTMEKYY